MTRIDGPPPPASRGRTGRLRGLAANLALSLASIVLFLLFCDAVVFRWVLPASDVPANAFVDGVVRYAPDQHGVWRVRDEIAAPYAINAQGWNSGVGDYVVARRPGVARLAVVGDSFIEALQVPYDRSVTERLATTLGSPGHPVDAYRFAISGAPMTQYLQMVEHIVGKYHPDWVVVLIVHNDFDESYKFKRGRYTSSFLKLRVENDRVVGEIPPQRWASGYQDWLRRTAIARFFLYRWQVRPEFLIDMMLPKAHAATPQFDANTDIGAVLSDEAANEAVTDYVFGRLDTVTRGFGAHLLLAMDGDRFAIYDGRTESPALILNRMATRMAAKHHIPFVDLQPAFAADWQAHHQRFEFAADSHWNQRGHEVAAAAIAARLREAGWHAP